MIKPGVGADHASYKGIGWCGSGMGSNTSIIDVKDDKIVRIRPMWFDAEYDEGFLKPWSVEVGGKKFTSQFKSLIPPFALAYKQRVYSKNRILYPLKRADFDPNGERNPQNRGISKFERISWDEATDIIANELKRQFDLYGPGSVLLQIDGHGETKTVHAAHGCNEKLLKILGGYTLQQRNADSWEGWFWGAKHVWSCGGTSQGILQNLFYDISHNTKMLLCWGCDPETTPWGWGGLMPSLMSFWFKDIGIKTIYVCPDLNYGAAVHADRWIPVRPNTDLAMQFAIASVWITEGLYDKEYLDTHTIGFDWLVYEVKGGDTGIPKTPEWAEGICGVPARVIKALARKWHKEATTTAHCNGGSYIRSTYSHEPARMEVCLLAMQGLGKPGQNYFKFIEWGLFCLPENVPVPRSEMIPNIAGAYHGGFHDMADRFIPKTLIPQAIMAEEPLHWFGQGFAGAPAPDQFVQYRFPKYDGDPYIHMVWTDSPCWQTCWNGGNEQTKALQSSKLDFVLAQHIWMENDCLFADILLPVNTLMEEEDIVCDIFGGSFTSLIYESQAISPIGESKSDWECVIAVAEKLGVAEEYTGGMNVGEWIENGFKYSGVKEFMTYGEFKEKEYFASPIADGWEKDPAGFINFYKDPEKYPLDTPTGKLEIYSSALAQGFPDDEERKPYPHYIDIGPSHDESLQHERGKTYPYLLVSNHPRWRVHANMDDVNWFREIETCKVPGPDGYLYEPVWINPVDAEELGIKHGDIVKLYNERGWVLGGAYVTERIVPRALLQDHGSRLDLIEPGVSDRAGANNLIAPSTCTSQNTVGEVTSGFLVGVEKVDLEELNKSYPEAFGRSFTFTGVNLSNWLV